MAAMSFAIAAAFSKEASKRLERLLSKWRRRGGKIVIKPVVAPPVFLKSKRASKGPSIAFVTGKRSGYKSIVVPDIKFGTPKKSEKGKD